MDSKHEDKRAHHRIPFAIDVALRGPTGGISGAKSQQLSPRGMVLATRDAYPEGTMVLVKFVLPCQDQAILARADVVARQPAKRGWSWTIIRFTEISQRSVGLIKDFLADPRPEARPAGEDEGEADNADEGCDPSREETETPMMLSYTVDYSDPESFLTDYAENISQGGLFLVTDPPPEGGSEVSITLKLPYGKGDFCLTGKVVWAQLGGDRPGAGIQFIDADAEALTSLAAHAEEVRKSTGELTLSNWSLKRS